LKEKMERADMLLLDKVQSMAILKSTNGKIQTLICGYQQTMVRRIPFISLLNLVI